MGNIFKESNTKTLSLKNHIIEYFILNGNATNTDLAHELQMSVPTISKVIGEMQEEGFVQEYGKLDTSGGRKPSLYGLNPDSGYFVGVDQDQDSISLGQMNFKGDLIQLDCDVPYHFENTQESLTELCGLIKDFIVERCVDPVKVLGVSINLTGRVNPDKGYSYSQFNFSEEPLTEVLTQKIGVPTFIENDSRAMAFGEYMKGCVNGEKDVLFVNLSWGIGMGIIIDGEPYKGRSGFAGEFGHIPVYDNGLLCRCGKEGCLETEVSGQAFHREVMRRIAMGEASRLTRKPKDDYTIHEMLDAVIQEDPLCQSVIGEIGIKLGRAVSAMINIFNPELVIIGGTMSRASDFLLHNVETSILKYSLNLVNKDTRICVSKLQGRAGIIGACMLARKAVLQGWG